MTQRTARFVTTIFLLISAPFLVYAVRHYLHEDYASMCLSLFAGLGMISAAAEPEFLTRKVSRVLAIRSTTDPEFDELTQRTALGDLCMTLAGISLFGWVVLKIA